MSKICIGTLSNRGFKAKTVECLLNLDVPFEKHIAIATQGYHIAENRNWLAIQAIKNECTHLFFVDDDMIFPSDTLTRLLAHQKDIVGVAYHPRFEIDKDTHKPLDKTHIITLKQEGSTELFECEAVGTGVMLIDVKIFEKTKRPWFEIHNHETGYTTMGEDWHFCKVAREAGFTVWCDPSLEIGHLGEQTF